MDKSPFRERRFAPAEVRRILRSAVDLAEQDKETAAAERSLSHEEIERLGGELGLPATAIQSALTHSAPSPAVIQTSPWNVPRRLMFEDEIDGELPASRHEDVIDAIHAHMGDGGSAQIVGRTLTWTPTPTAQGQQRRLIVTVRTRDGKTRIRVDENLQPTYLGLHLGLTLGLGLGGGVATVVPIAAATGWLMAGLGVAVLVMIASLLLARLIYWSMIKHRTRQLTALRARLDTEVRRGIAAGAPKAARRRIEVTAPSSADEAEAEAEAEEEAEVRAPSRAR